MKLYVIIMCEPDCSPYTEGKAFTSQHDAVNCARQSLNRVADELGLSNDARIECNTECDELQLFSQGGRTIARAFIDTVEYTK